MDRIARRLKDTRDATYEHRDPHGVSVRRTLGIGHLGGATLDNEENYLIKKLFTAGLGIVAVENQARI
jgi:formate dehydrogenase major subunit